MKITGQGKIKDAKIKKECGELNFDGLNFLADDFKRIAQLVEDGEPLQITVETIGIDKIKIVTTGRIKECTIKPDACKLKYDGLDFTTEQYSEIAAIIKEEITCEQTIEMLQQELDFEAA